MLLARDSDAFAARDWARVANDFAADRFEGISANGSADPAKWTLAHPTLESYRDRWLQAAAEHRARQLPEHRLVLYRISSLKRIDVRGDRALAWKHFHADEALPDGQRWRVNAHTVYRLHCMAGVWKIAGFVAHLPGSTAGSALAYEETE